MSEVVKLRNGSEEFGPAVYTTVLVLKKLSQNAPAYLFELVCKCRDQDYQFSGDAETRLKALAIVESDGSITNTVKNVVLSAVEGDGFKMKFVNPVLEG